MKDSNRLFVAIWIPPDQVRRVEQIQRDLTSGIGDSIRWTGHGQLHLTLRFLGHVPDSDLEPLRSAITRAIGGVSSFPTSLEGFGFFPNRRNPRVLWIGLRDASGDLNRLQSNLTKETAVFGNPPDTRPFHAHLTIGRTRTGGKLDRTQTESLERFKVPNLGGWTISGLSLVNSTLASGGSRYAIVQSFRFGDSPKAESQD